MLKSYLSLSIRHLVRHRFYAFLNILGLSVGGGCLIIAVLFFDHHLQYNAGHEHADRIYRIGRHVTDAEGAKYTMGGHSLAPTLKAEIPEVAEAARILNRPMIVTAGEKSFTEQVAVIDTSFTRILTVNMAIGDAETGLLENGACFITQSLSEKLFPEGEPLGRTISISYKWLDGEFTVAGILEDIPDNCTYPLQYEVLTATYPPNDFWRKQLWETWPSRYFSWPIWNFVKLREEADPAAFHRQLEAFSDRHPGIIEGKTIRYFAQPLPEAHLYTQRYYGIGEGEDINRCLGILGIGLLVLFLACLNYVNLVTAQSPLRSREVGLRKVSGALRHHLIGQCRRNAGHRAQPLIRQPGGVGSSPCHCPGCRNPRRSVPRIRPVSARPGQNGTRLEGHPWALLVTSSTGRVPILGLRHPDRGHTRCPTADRLCLEQGSGFLPRPRCLSSDGAVIAGPRCHAETTRDRS